MGLAIGDTFKSAEKFFEQLKEGLRIFTLLINDAYTRILLMDYLDTLVESMPYRANRTVYIKIGAEVLIALAITRGVSLANKAIKAKQAARIGPFPAGAIDEMVDLADELSTPDIKVEKPPITVIPEDLPKSKYTPREGVTPLVGDTVHKRYHPDGRQPDPENPMDYGDPYTLQADGKPMGAKEGVMPKKAKGLRDFNPEYQRLIDEEGYPDVAKFDDYENFSDIKPTELKKGDIIYRIIDEGSSEARGTSGSYWARELPKNKTEWRRGYAVKDSWNDNGYYVKHVVGKDGLKTWEGTTAGQQYDAALGKQFYLTGGQQQLFIDRGVIDNFTPTQTHWLDTL